MLNLLNIIGTFDFADEVGREKLLSLIEFMLGEKVMSEDIIRRTIQLLEKVLPDAKQRMGYVFKICQPPDDVELDKLAMLQMLRTIFFTICSKNVVKSEPCILKLYEEMIAGQCTTKNLSIRDWALKCSTTIALLSRQYARGVYDDLSREFILHHEQSIWATCALAICELLCRYGIAYFEDYDDVDDTYDDGNETVDANRSTYADELSRTAARSPMIKSLVSIFDSCENKVIHKALVQGLCKLILSGQRTPAMVSKMLLLYFRTIDEDEHGVEDITDLEVSQMLGVFFETLVRKNQQDCLPEALFDAVDIMMQSVDGRYNFMPETVIQFVAVTTAPSDRNNRLNVHNRLAEIFVEMILQRSDEKEFVKIVVKQLNELQINADVVLPMIKPQICELLDLCPPVADYRTTKILKSIIDQGSSRTTSNINLPVDSDNRTDNGSQSGDEDYEEGDLPTERNDSPDENLEVENAVPFKPMRRSIINATHRLSLNGSENEDGENQQPSTSGRQAAPVSLNIHSLSESK